MSFVVSARKYRPNRFEDVVGQEHVALTLKNALRNDKLAHAFLFCGPRGVGKTTCARILAKVLNCTNVSADFEPCNTCESCSAFNENASFNIIELDAASNNSVEHIRQLIEQVRFQPQQGKYKVFIIDEVHMLSSQAFNAFLKTLEEPPPYAIFILATTEKHKIIPTILSRCQIFDFKRIQVQSMVSHLQMICEREGLQADPEALHIIAQKADGALRDALSIFDRIASAAGKEIKYEDVIQNLNVLDHDYFFKFTDKLLTGDLPGLLLLFEEVLRNGFEPDLFITNLAEHFRNLLVCKDQETISLLEVSPKLKERYFNQSHLASTAFLLSALNTANECDINFKMAKNKRLHAELAILKMGSINNLLSNVPVFANGGQVPIMEKKTLDGNDVKQEVTKSSQTITQNPQDSVDAGQNLSHNDEVENLPVEPSKKEEPQPEISIDTKAVEEKPTLVSAVPKLLNLDALTAEVEAEMQTTVAKDPKLDQESLTKAWATYVASKDNHVRSVLESAELGIEGKVVKPVVGSNLARNTLLQEMDLMEHLRQELHCPDLTWEIEVDESKGPAAKAEKPPKPLTSKEKFVKMMEVNPHVKDALDRFELKPDE
ncbi:MAG: DNA polymerase III subunit gamma/tau [Saprospiraceae bacterium]|nr:DNA polymerase III subunit gamma/tau [Saprospiraceae bacterium]